MSIPTKEQLEVNKAHIASEKAKSQAKPNQVYVCKQNKKGEQEFEFIDLKDVFYEGKPIKETLDGLGSEIDKLKKQNEIILKVMEQLNLNMNKGNPFMKNSESKKGA
jgi:hypothetical protein